MIDNMESAFNAKGLEIDTLRERLLCTDAQLEKLVHANDCEVSALRARLEEKCKENQDIDARLACIEKVCVQILFEHVFWLRFCKSNA